jgi:hypothetical protein
MCKLRECPATSSSPRRVHSPRSPSTSRDQQKYIGARRGATTRNIGATHARNRAQATKMRMSRAHGMLAVRWVTTETSWSGAPQAWRSVSYPAMRVCRAGLTPSQLPSSPHVGGAEHPATTAVHWHGRGAGCVRHCCCCRGCWAYWSRRWPGGCEHGRRVERLCCVTDVAASSPSTSPVSVPSWCGQTRHMLRACCTLRARAASAGTRACRSVDTS